jgi:hypothetical protein
MTILKTILVVVLVIIAIPLIIALFVKKEYSVEREISIQKPKEEVFNFIKYLKNQDYYSKWVMQDPNMKKSFKGTDGTVGFVYAWDGNKQAGKGEQEIKEIKDGEQIDVEIRFEKPFAGVAHTPIITEALSPGETKVKWGMKGKSSYPMNIMNLFIDGMLGKDLEKSLVTLKGILENNKQAKN